MTIQTRFSNLITATSGLPLWDIPVRESENILVVPTLGMIVPNWLLFIPKRHSFNFGSQSQALAGELTNSIQQVCGKIGYDDYVVFEHGASEVGSVVGCGVDHSHVHVVFGTEQTIAPLWDALAKDLAVPTVGQDLRTTLEELPARASYYMAWRRGVAAIETSPRNPISQRFRRVIASHWGCPEKWDYKSHAFIENIVATREKFDRSAPLAA